MDEHLTPPTEQPVGEPVGEPVGLDEEPKRALVLRPEAALVAEPIARAPSRLPAIIGQRLPALWGGGRGPLARAVVAGGLLALGSVVGRMAANPPTALLPSGKAPVTPPPLARPTRVEITVETEIGERTTRQWGRSTTRWGRRRLRIVQEWPEG
jgi:hypothetical protein